MRAILKAADLSQAEFLDLIGQIHRPDSDRRIWLEAPDGWAFDWWQGLDELLAWCGSGRGPIQTPTRDCLGRSTVGRMFAPEGELRWRVIPSLGSSRWRTLFLGHADWGDTVLKDHSHCLHNLQAQQKQLFLWGRQTEVSPDEWIELRIPHRFRFPLKAHAQNVRLLVEQWHDESGEPHFVRWCDLEPYPEAT